MYRIIYFCNLLVGNVRLLSDEVLALLLFYLLQDTSLIIDPHYLAAIMLVFSKRPEMYK